MLASLLNNWDAMRVVVNNTVGNVKLKYNDIQNLILIETVRRRDFSKISCSSYAMNIDTRDKGHDKSKSKNKYKSKSRSV